MKRLWRGASVLDRVLAVVWLPIIAGNIAVGAIFVAFLSACVAALLVLNLDLRLALREQRERHGGVHIVVTSGASASSIQKMPSPYPRRNGPLRYEDLVDESGQTFTFQGIAARALRDPAFRAGLLAGAAVCRANDPLDRPASAGPPCPAGMAAVYIENLAYGEQP